MGTPQEQLPGLDLDALTRWLDAIVPGLRRGALSGAVLTGGRSNLTYRVTDGSSTWALRRPPLAHVLPTAHDMAREHRVISALAGTAVPVPEPVAFCADAAVLGSPFYLMRFVDGVVLDRADLVEALDVHSARRACEVLVDTLVALHALDPAAVGLGDFGHPDGFLARQVRRWHQQWQASETRPLAALARTVEALHDALPPAGRAGIVHGDYRLTNVIFDLSLTSVAAVVDWEMATLGDPLTDVGLLAVYQDLAAAGATIMPMMLPERGFLTGDAMAERYARAAGVDVAELGWYRGLGYFKLAIVAEGIHHRYLAGKTVGAGFEHMGAAVPDLLAAALRELEA